MVFINEVPEIGTASPELEHQTYTVFIGVSMQEYLENIDIDNQGREERLVGLMTEMGYGIQKSGISGWLLGRCICLELDGCFVKRTINFEQYYFLSDHPAVIDVLQRSA